MSQLSATSRFPLYTQALNRKSTMFTPLNTDHTVSEQVIPIFYPHPKGSIIKAIGLSTNSINQNAITLYFSRRQYEMVNIGSELNPVMSNVEQTTHYPKDTILLPPDTPYGVDGSTPELDIMLNLSCTRIDDVEHNLFIGNGYYLSAKVQNTLLEDEWITIHVHGEDF